LFDVFITKIFLHSFARQTIQLALLIVWFALQRNKWSTWRWPVEGPKHFVERSYV